jgi:GT2 family glycosyltransferase
MAIHLIDDASPEPFEFSASPSPTPVHQLRLEKRTGFVGAINYAWRLCTGDISVILNNDTIPSPHLIECLAAVLEQDGSIAAAGPASDNPRDLFQFRGPVPAKPDLTPASPDGRPDKPTLQYSFTDYLTGMCMAVRRSAIKEDWLFDPLFSPGYFEDLDLSCKLRSRGWKLGILDSEHIHHTGAATFGAEPGLDEIMLNNYFNFSSRWNHLPQHRELESLLWI